LDLLHPRRTGDFSYECHTGPVTLLDVSPFCQHLFLLCGGVDGEVRLYLRLRAIPVDDESDFCSDEDTAVRTFLLLGGELSRMELGRKRCDTMSFYFITDGL